MYYIKKRPDEEKPYYIVENPDLQSKSDKFYSEKYADIPITEAQKNMLSANKQKVHWLSTQLPVPLVDWICRNLLYDEDEWAYCCHDQDKYTEDVINDDGEVVHRIGDNKSIHTHVLIIYANRTALSYSAYLFRTLSIKGISRANLAPEWNYLIHNTDKCRREHKYFYDESRRVCSCKAVFEKRCVDDNASVWDKMIEDLLNGEHTYSMCKKYGGVFIVNRKKLLDVVNAIRFELEPPSGDEHYVIGE